jgi:hypothetical protein
VGLDDAAYDANDIKTDVPENEAVPVTFLLNRPDDLYGALVVYWRLIGTGEDRVDAATQFVEQTGFAKCPHMAQCEPIELYTQEDNVPEGRQHFSIELLDVETDDGTVLDTDRVSAELTIGVNDFPFGTIGFASVAQAEAEPSADKAYKIALRREFGDEHGLLVKLSTSYALRSPSRFELEKQGEIHIGAERSDGRYDRSQDVVKAGRYGPRDPESADVDLCAEACLNVSTLAATFAVGVDVPEDGGVPPCTSFSFVSGKFCFLHPQRASPITPDNLLGGATAESGFYQMLYPDPSGTIAAAPNKDYTPLDEHIVFVAAGESEAHASLTVLADEEPEIGEQLAIRIVALALASDADTATTDFFGGAGL